MSCIKRFIYCSLFLFLLLILWFLVGIPVLFKYSYWLQKSVLFLNYVSYPYNPNYKNISSYGFSNNSESYDLWNNDHSVKLGLWYIPSNNAEPLGTIVYAHGNSANRVHPRRVKLYQKLVNLFNVVTFDYRGYGDSSNIDPSESGLVDDMIFVIQWTKVKIGNEKLYVWGHSLGTGVAVESLSILNNTVVVDALFLESPFNNLRDELREHNMAKLFAFLPWFESCFVNSMYNNGLKFESDKHIQNLKIPILILHSEDDRIIPINLGRKLYKVALTRPGGHNLTQMITFNKLHGYGHNCIFSFSNLIDYIKNFTNGYRADDIINI